MSQLLFPGKPRELAEEQNAIWDAVAEFASDEPASDASGSDENTMAPIENGADRDTAIRNFFLSGDAFNLKDYIAAIESDFIRVALADCDGSVSASARLLGIQRTTLIEKMRKFSIGRPE